MNPKSPRLALSLLVVLIIMLLASPSNALANGGGEWTWMSGANTHSQPGVYGVKGVPDPANVPGARWGSTWPGR